MPDWIHHIKTKWGFICNVKRWDEEMPVVFPFRNSLSCATSEIYIKRKKLFLYRTTQLFWNQSVFHQAGFTIKLIAAGILLARPDEFTALTSETITPKQNGNSANREDVSEYNVSPSETNLYRYCIFYCFERISRWIECVYYFPYSQEQVCHAGFLSIIYFKRNYFIQWRDCIFKTITCIKLLKLPILLLHINSPTISS